MVKERFERIRVGLWPGQALALFAGYSKWIHLSTNTLPFYNVFPRLVDSFSEKIDVHGSDETSLSI
jgi:hypothetical protein